jgi:hypothetical protein
MLYVLLQKSDLRERLSNFKETLKDTSRLETASFLAFIYIIAESTIAIFWHI